MQRLEYRFKHSLDSRDDICIPEPQRAEAVLSQMVVELKAGEGDYVPIRHKKNVSCRHPNLLKGCAC
jgi:hypothetical protein